MLCNQLDPGTCADDSKYVFFDSFHPTERTYKILVDKLLQKYINNFV
jgi:phospholipase/lecithinase/hemolysin